MRALLFCVAMLLSIPSQATVISGLLYATGSSLRIVDFDGTNFGGPFTELEAISPPWTAMSYDGAGGKLYYATGNSLRVVGFDGTSFTGPFTELEALSPDWKAMSYDVAGGKMYYTIENSLRVVDFDGTSFGGPLTVLEAISPDWTAMSYDVGNGKMYYSTGTSLRVVDFDGISFGGPLTELEALSPAWTAMSLLFTDTPIAEAPAPGSLALMILGLFSLLLARAWGSGLAIHHCIRRAKRRYTVPESLDYKT